MTSSICAGDRSSKGGKATYTTLEQHLLTEEAPTQVISKRKKI